MDTIYRIDFTHRRKVNSLYRPAVLVFLLLVVVVVVVVVYVCVCVCVCAWGGGGCERRGGGDREARVYVWGCVYVLVRACVCVLVCACMCQLECRCITVGGLKKKTERRTLTKTWFS